MKVLLMTLPEEGGYVNWTTPDIRKYTKMGVKYMPLGILSLATSIEDICDVKVLDPESEGWSIKKTIKIIKKEKPDIVGFSAITSRVYALKTILENIDVPYKVVGGPHATHHAKEILSYGADAVFVGQITNNEFRELIKEFDNLNLNLINNKIIVKCKTKINEIGIIKRHFLDIKKYFFKGKVFFKSKNRMSMFFGVGCPFSCLFCDVQLKKQQLKTPKLIVDEMEYLKSIGAETIHILDDNFNVNEEHVHKILDEMDRRNFRISEWSARGRATMNKKLAKRLAEHNFKRIHVGIEALDNNILKFLNKRLTVKEIKKFCKTMNENGIEVLSYFILGTPKDTKKYLKELPDKIKRFGIKHSYFNILFPSPNTEYYRSLLRNGNYKKDYWTEYMKNPTSDYKIPFPYGKEKLDKILNYIEEIKEELK